LLQVPLGEYVSSGRWIPNPNKRTSDTSKEDQNYQTPIMLGGTKKKKNETGKFKHWRGNKRKKKDND